MFGDHVNYAYVAMTHPARLELMLSSQASPGRGAAHFREVEWNPAGTAVSRTVWVGYTKGPPDHPIDPAGVRRAFEGDPHADS